jgi:hydrogenase maturation protease
MNDTLSPIRIVGIGNVLMGDDGLGPYAIKILESRFTFPDHVELVDGGTPGLDFLPYITDARSVIGLREALMAAELTDSSPAEMVLLGVIPESTEQGTTLSKPVQASVEHIVEAVLAELDRLDAPPTPRDEPLEPALWWV